MKRFICDFHTHSKYSRATSKDMNVVNLSRWAKLKGVDLLGTGDFTHFLWMEELKSHLRPEGEGLFSYDDTLFILTTEVSNIFSKGGKVRKIHNMIFAPSFEVAGRINEELGAIGNLSADGRPILGLEASELVKIVMRISRDCFIVPSHIWTPWFSLFGANSGFDRIEDCFEDQTQHIYALETGLSSDPAMNWRWSALDGYTLVSNSDAHCVHPETLVYMANGKPIPIKDLNSHEILSIDLNGHMKQIANNYLELHKLQSPPTLYKITSRTKSITVTSNHRFFVLNDEKIREKFAAELKKGDLVASLRRIPNEGRSAPLPKLNVDREFKISREGFAYLRAKRLQNRKTQKDAGKFVGKSEDCIWLLENNKVRSCKEPVLNGLCEYYEIDVERFNERYVLSCSFNPKAPKWTNREFCQILGYILGDGGIERDGGKIYGFSVTDKDFALLAIYRNLIKKVFNFGGRLEKQSGRKSYTIAYSVLLMRYLQQIVPHLFTHSPDRRVPEIIFKLPIDQVAAFLRGLFDAEGSVYHHSVSLCSSSLLLIKEVQSLLLRFEISSYIYPDFERQKRKWRYKLIIYGQASLMKFVKEIGFGSHRKKKRLSKYLSSVRQKPKDCFVDPLPFGETVRKIADILEIPVSRIPKNLQYHWYHKDRLKRSNAKEFVEIFSNHASKRKEKIPQLEKLTNFAQSDIIWESVQEVRKVDSDCKYVYDLTVPTNENYVANGFIVHNSPSKIGREANIFSERLNYYQIIEALKEKDKERFLGTIEFFPQEGKYHYDGHRNCEVIFSPAQTRANEFKCPRCGRRLTVGVMHRVEELADRKEGFIPENSTPFYNLIPLAEIIAEAIGKGVNTVAVENEYRRIVQDLGGEFRVLLEATEDELMKVAPKKVTEGILRVRKGQVNIIPGHDGVYGKIKIFKEGEGEEKKQLTLF